MGKGSDKEDSVRNIQFCLVFFRKHGGKKEDESDRIIQKDVRGDGEGSTNNQNPLSTGSGRKKKGLVFTTENFLHQYAGGLNKLT